MKKKNFELNADCGCDSWVEALVEELFSRLDIKIEEVCINEMDEKRIFCWASVWDETLEPDEEDDEEYGGWDEKNYVIKYYIDSEPWEPMLLSFDFYDDERVIEEHIKPDGSVIRYSAPNYLDTGEYKIVSRRGKVKCIRL